MKIFLKGLCLAHFFCISTENTLYTEHVWNLWAPPSRGDPGCWNSCSSAEEQTRSLRRRDSLAGNIASLIQQLETWSHCHSIQYCHSIHSIDVATPRAKTTRWTWPFSGRSKTSPTTTVILANSSIIERPTTSSFSGLSSLGTMQHCKSLVAQLHVQVARSSSQHFLCETERSRGRESTGRDLQHNGHILPPSNRDCPTGYKIITSSSWLFGC